jgi:hypothetical protein
MVNAKFPVISKKPSIIKKIPPIIDIHLRYSDIFSIYFVALEKENAIKRNGIARPIENIERRNAPWRADASVEASSRIDPKIGPTHGVQPNAKAPPIRTELDGLPTVSQDGNFILLSA